MKTWTLATKVQIPPQPHHAVRRAQLIDALERRISDYKLILLSAPAGYGKTTFLTQWAQSSGFSTAWLSIDQEDNDLERFLRNLLATWKEIQPDIQESLFGLLLSTMSPDTEAVLTAFINVAHSVPDHTVFVFDDYHLIEHSSIHKALAYLLDHLPPMLHFVLAGRSEPPLRLARFRARDELLEFRADDLQFVEEETADFLNRLMGLDLSHDEVAKLQAQLEGWIAGLQLVALSRQRRLAGADKLLVSGKHRFIADFLSEDVLAPLTDDMRRFLLQTSILDRLCESLCDAVTGRTGGQEMLERIERENLFLMPLDDSRQWFRYHRLFADFLREELKRHYSSEIGDLHRRAAYWYLDNDLPERAFAHALEGGDIELVVQIFDLYLGMKLFGGEVRVAMHWIDSLPEAWYSDHTMLGVHRASALVATGALDVGARYLDEVEQRLVLAAGEDVHEQLARVTAIRCFIACFRNDLPLAEEYGYQALRELPEADLSFRADTYQALGDTYRSNRRWEEARVSYLKVLEFDQPDFSVRPAHVYGALADLFLRQGRLQIADSYWKKALQTIQEQQNWGRLPLPLIGWVYIRRSEILYEWNELAKAWEHLFRGLERAELGGDVRALIAGYMIAGRMKLTEGDVEAAADYLERARALVEKTPFPDWINRFARFQLEVWLSQDRLRAAVNWINDMLPGETFTGHPESEVAQVAVTRVLIVNGDAPSVKRALALLESLLKAAEAEGRIGVQIEGLSLRALAHWKQDDRANAMTSFEHALRLAEPEGYIRLFVDLGTSMVRLLQEARSRNVMSDYVGKLLAAFSANLTSAETTLPEPLSIREQEILTLVAAGLTNQEIADKLVISPETVKKHASNIYSKLGVSNRTEAAARARALDLLH